MFLVFTLDLRGARAMPQARRNGQSLKFYDDWLTNSLPDDEQDCETDDDRSDEQFDRWDRERDLT